MLRLKIALLVAEMQPHINGRRQKHGDESVRACDIGFKVQMDGDLLLAQLCTSKESADNLAKALWNDDGAVREVALDHIKLGHKLKDHTLTFTTELDSDAELLAIKDVTLGKFVLVPRQGRTLELRFQAQAKVTKEEFGTLSDGLTSKVQIAIEPQQTELALAVEDKATAE